MKLQDALKKILKEFGMSVLKEKRLVFLIADYKAFDDYPAVKQIMKAIAEDGFGKELCRLGMEGSSEECLDYAGRLKKTLSEERNFKPELVGFAVECILAAMGIVHSVKEPSDHGFDPFANRSADSFFPEGYLVEYPDVAKAGVDPARHYAGWGKKEGRDNGNHPGEDIFFAAGYLEMYPDVAKAKVDPWKHYVIYGKKEGRDNGNHPGEDIFFAAGYLEMYPDVAKAKVDPWQHYVIYGKKEGRDNGVHPKKNMFCAQHYLEMYPDVARAKMDPWRHYVQYGKSEGRGNGLNTSPTGPVAGGQQNSTGAERNRKLISFLIPSSKPL